MKRLTVISPHPDDAIFSVGGFLIQAQKKGIEIQILDLFNVQSYSLRTKNTEDAIMQIEYEEIQAVKQLKAELKLMNFKEAGMRGILRLRDILGWDFTKFQADFGEREFYEEVRTALLRHLSAEKPDLVLAPLGVGGHIDHLIAREIIMELLKQGELKQSEIMFYEELPYSINTKWLENAVREFTEFHGALTYKEIIINNEIQQKKSIMNLYKSQIKEKEIQNIIDYASHIGEDASRIGEDASHIGEDASRIGEDASRIGEYASRIGEEASHIGEGNFVERLWLSRDFGGSESV